MAFELVPALKEPVRVPELMPLHPTMPWKELYEMSLSVSIDRGMGADLLVPRARSQ